MKKGDPIYIGTGKITTSYANFAGVMHTNNEFVFDFHLIIPPEKDVTRVILPPTVAKEFLEILKKSIEELEK